MRNNPTIEFEDTMPMLEACRAAAQNAGANVSVAVVDSAGALLAFQRFEGAKPYTVDLAIRKARTAATLGMPTSVLEKLARDGKLQNPEVLASGGGLPVVHDGKACGGIGVSGTSTDIDEQIAAAGARISSAVSPGDRPPQSSSPDQPV